MYIPGNALWILVVILVIIVVWAIYVNVRVLELECESAFHKGNWEHCEQTIAQLKISNDHLTRIAQSVEVYEASHKRVSEMLEKWDNGGVRVRTYNLN